MGIVQRGGKTLLIQIISFNFAAPQLAELNDRWIAGRYHLELKI
jgi:hypothetical protein